MTSILCIGNFGTSRKEQFDVAKLLCDLCCGTECKLILGLGNNIYPEGVSSINDNQFLEKFEIPYSILPNNLKFYNILGNRDYQLKGSVKAQINYQNSNKSFRWIMPYNYYCFMKQFDGVPVEFIAIDTNLDKMGIQFNYQNSIMKKCEIYYVVLYARGLKLNQDKAPHIS